MIRNDETVESNLMDAEPEVKEVETNEREVFVEGKETVVDEDNDSAGEAVFCSKCGQVLSEKQQFCPNCGNKVNQARESMFCVKCGSTVEQDQKYCPNCGNKMPSMMNVAMPGKITGVIRKIKNSLTRKKIIVGCIALVAAISIACVARIVIPNIFVSTSEYLAVADYSTAYEKAKEEDKESVLVENLIATLAAQAENNLNDSSSFNLKKVWYDKDDNYIVMSISGTNKMGGMVTNHWCYSVFKGGYSLVDSLSDTDSEQIEKYDDEDDIVDKVVHNMAVNIVKEAVVDKYKLDNELVKRINDLHKADKLQDVTLLEETKSLYPSKSDTSDSET